MNCRKFFPILLSICAFPTCGQALHLAVHLEAKLDTPVVMQSAITCKSGSQIVAIGEDGAIYVWTLPSVTARKISLAEGHVGAVDCDANGNLALGLNGGKVRILDATSGEILQRIEAQLRVRNFSLSPDGNLLALVVTGSPTQLWDTRSGQKLATGVTNMGATWSAAFSTVGDVFVSADEDTRVRVYSRSGKLLYTADAGLLEPFAVAFTPDGKRFAVAGADGAVTLFQTSSGKKLKTSAGTGNPIFALNISPGSGRLAALELDDFTLDPKAIGLWDMQSSDLQPSGIDTKGIIGFGTNKTHSVLLKQEDPKTLTVSSMQ